MAIECRDGVTIINDDEVTGLFNELKLLVPDLSFNQEGLERLLTEAQADMCKTNCSIKGSCAVERFNRETVRNVIVNYIKEVVMTVTGLNN